MPAKAYELEHCRETRVRRALIRIIVGCAVHPRVKRAGGGPPAIENVDGCRFRVSRFTIVLGRGETRTDVRIGHLPLMGGLTDFFHRHLKALLAGGPSAPA